MKPAEENNRATPFLKWAGGKRWLVRDHLYLTPSKFNRYIEPFLGSGAVYFHVDPSAALLGDSNQSLIDAYRGLKRDYKKVLTLLRYHQRNHGDQYYYRMRESIPTTLEMQAARLIYLNRTCWNGLYRVNTNGQFNVLIGSKSSIVREEDDFAAIAKKLKRAKIKCVDFEKLIDEASKNDFLFVDPPYTVSHNQNAFIKYNEKLFSWNDQLRLAKAMLRAKKRGVKILGTNAYHKGVIDLYEEDFRIRKVERKSVISCTNDSRKDYAELVISANMK